MNNQPRPVPPSPRNKFMMPLAICGCLLLGVIGIVAVMVGLGAKAFRSGSATFKQAGVGAEQFLTALEKQDNQAAFATMATHTRDGRTAESVAAAMEALAKQHGHPVSHRQLPQFNMDSTNGVTTVSLTYQETFEKGETPVQIVMLSEGGQWHVESFDFQH